MAERRMFSQTITRSDAFIDMPLSAQALYFHFGMHADDDGFVVNPKSILRMIGASNDDIELLCDKNFIILFESGICVVRHWKIHNYIPKDRYKATRHTVEKSNLELDENGEYLIMDTDCIQTGYRLYTQDRLGKDRLGKDNIYTSPTGEEAHRSLSIDYQEIVDLFNRICTSIPKVKVLTEPRRKSLKSLYPFIEENGGFQSYFERVQASDYLCGRTDTRWNACFDWIFKRANAVKILEGNYDNRSAKKTENKPDYKNATMEV